MYAVLQYRLELAFMLIIHHFHWLSFGGGMRSDRTTFETLKQA